MTTFFLSSCPHLLRASTSSKTPKDQKKDMDGRNKSGHDNKRVMLNFAAPPNAGNKVPQFSLTG